MVLRAVAKFPRPLLLIGLISGISFAAQCLVTDDAVSFGFVGCRLWQFMIGTAAFYISKAPDNGYRLLVDEESQSEEKAEMTPIRKQVWYTLTVCALSLVVLLPFINETIVKDTSVLTRLISTFLTGITIVFGAEATTILSVPPLISSFLLYIGDISYSVYLVHWPLVILTKYLDIFNHYYAFPLIIAIFALGILQYTLFEKPLSRQSQKIIYAVILMLNIACIVLLQNQSAISDAFANPENYLDVNENLFTQCKNEIESQFKCKNPNLPYLAKRKPFHSFLCQYDGTGSLTVLLTGNSYAMRMYQSLVNSGKHKFKKLIVATANTCVLHKKLSNCEDVGGNLHRTLADVKPDVVIINQRYWEIAAFKKPLTDAKNDKAVAAMREDWAMISNYTKKIIIIEPAGGLPKKVDLLKPIRLNEADLSVYAVPLDKYKAEVDPGWDRVLKSVDKCPKCKTIGIRSHFCDRKSCAVYDAERRISLYCDPNHHAPTAVKRYMPSIVREIKF
uniref:SGNH domain-containing protein n=1 Tax=Panagrellus redivivus TaxID=6233 RepID=A0A7E4VSW1_PANRE